MLFHDRRNAGILLANKISQIPLDKNNTIVIALPRGGVPVAFEIAKKLQIPLDIILVKKIEAPNLPELAVGAVSEDNEIFYNEDLIERLGYETSDLQPFKDHAFKELQKISTSLRREYPSIPLIGKDIILVDDGIATGATIKVVIQLLKKKKVGKIIVAAPVSSQKALNELGKQVDMVEVIMAPPVLNSFGEWYEDFTQVETEEVIDMLSEFSSFQTNVNSEEVIIKDSNISLSGNINRTDKIKSWIIFAHGSGSSHKSVRNVNVAIELTKAGHATLLFDLLTLEEDAYSNRFNIPLLSKRLLLATRWLMKSKYYQEGTPIGYFGASTGTAAALEAAAKSTEQNLIYAVTSRGGRPDMIDKKTLGTIYIPTLLIVGEEDIEVIELNKIAAESLPNCRLTIVPCATHLFEEPGALAEVTKLAIEWFDGHVPNNIYHPLNHH
ncbi:MAG: phosphoribosyltransferase [Bacteriovorax sp.]|nr:phosphoribosyltransferase [Bacteriovorax sp.]